LQTLTAFLKAYSDSSFTNPHEVVLPQSPPDCKGNFTHMGAKYWGFETARHRATQISTDGKNFTFDADAHHWFDIGLTHRSEIRKINVSTKWFTGNQVPEISIELIDRKSNERTEVLPRTALNPDAEHEFDIDPMLATDCRVKCFHEGGIARVTLLGTEGEALYDQPNLLLDATISHTSNEHYGKPLDAVKGNRNVQHMVGWESARSGFGESTIFTLPRPALIESVIVDTYMHRLNPPLSCHVFGALLGGDENIDQITPTLPGWKLVFPDESEIKPEDFQQYMADQLYLPEHKQFEIKLYQEPDSPWKPLISFAGLQPDTWHEFDQLESDSEFNVIFYLFYPNGGIHGLKMFGRYRN
jgi:allantoicase